ARCGRLASGSNSASIAPVTTTSPALPARRRTLPDTGEGTSTTALAVSIETSGSSRRMVSPSLTNHSTMVASGRPSPRSGRWKVLVWLMRNTLAGLGGRGETRRAGRSGSKVPRPEPRHRQGSVVRDRAARGGDDAIHARQVLHFQPEQRDVRVVAGDALDRRDQVVHRLLGQARGDLGAEAGGARGFLHDHAAAGA